MLALEPVRCSAMKNRFGTPGAVVPKTGRVSPAATRVPFAITPAIADEQQQTSSDKTMTTRSRTISLN